jgi:hypothetical protein
MRFTMAPSAIRPGAITLLCAVAASCGGTVRTSDGSLADLDAGAQSDAPGSGGAGTGGTGGAAGSTPDAGHPPDTIVLDPSTIQFFALPINSMRAAISGWDPAVKACATITWDYSNNGMYLGAHCDNFKAGFPYVNITMNTDGPCGAWQYAGNVELDAAKGCVDFKMFGPASVDLVDVVAHVHGSAFTGSVVAAHLTKATLFGIDYISDVPENVYVQSANDLGLPTWVQVSLDGNPVELFDRCDIPKCGEPSGVCGAAQHQVINITQGTYAGQVYLSWDGNQRKLDAANNCTIAEPAPPGNYDVKFCYAWAVAQSPMGTDVVDPQCAPMTFSHPSDKVVLSVNNGG